MEEISVLEQENDEDETISNKRRYSNFGQESKVIENLIFILGNC